MEEKLSNMDKEHCYIEEELLYIEEKLSDIETLHFHMETEHFHMEMELGGHLNRAKKCLKQAKNTLFEEYCIFS